jgi:hypothetical protein
LPVFVDGLLVLPESPAVGTSGRDRARPQPPTMNTPRGIFASGGGPQKRGKISGRSGERQGDQVACETFDHGRGRMTATPDQTEAVTLEAHPGHDRPQVSARQILVYEVAG